MKFGSKGRRPQSAAIAPSSIRDARGNMIRGAQPMQQAANEINQVTMENPGLGSQVAGVSPISVDGGLDVIQFELDNSGSGTDTLFRLGDPLGALAAVAGITTTAPTGGLIDPAFVNSTIQTKPFSIGIMQLVTSTNSRQLTSQMRYYQKMNASGNYSVRQVPLSLAPRNTQQNQLVQTIEITSAMVLSDENALTWLVLAGEFPVVTFYPRLYKGN